MISYVVRVLGIVVVVLLQAGCGAQIAALHGIPVVNPADSEAVFAGTRLVTDSHEGSITVMGPTIFHDHDLLKNTYTIRAWVNPSKPELNNRFQVLVRAFFPKRVYLKQAFSEGEPLGTNVIDRERVDCGPDCAVVETVGIDIRADDMAHYADSGLSFEVVGRRDKVVMTIPSTYIEAVLRFYKQYQRGGPSARVAASRRPSDAIPAHIPRQVSRSLLAP